MSLYSIRAAKKRGMVTFVERGSTHILTQDEILKEEYHRFNRDFSINSSLIEREIKEYEEADYIAVPSLFVRDSFIAQGVAKEKLFMNSFGANKFFKSFSGLKKTGEKFRIVYVGTLSIRKGLIYFFKSLENLKMLESQYEVLILGSIEEEMEKIFSKYRRPNWLVLGHVDHYQLPDYLNTCDIGVQPSLEEGLSMVIPQMMACGIPVIITPNTGGQNIIRDEVNGFVVPIRDPKAISEKIEWAFENPQLLFEMKTKAAEAINNDFTWDAYGDRFINFLNATIK